MRNPQLFSRRNTDRKVDFRPDVAELSPYVQMRRLELYLGQETARPDDIEDCPDALNYLREYTYRKIFTGTTHAEYLELDASDPTAIDWLIAVHGAETDHHIKQKSGESSAFTTRKNR